MLSSWQTSLVVVGSPQQLISRRLRGCKMCCFAGCQMSGGPNPEKHGIPDKGGTQIDGGCVKRSCFFWFLGIRWAWTWREVFFFVRNHESVPHFFSCCNYEMTFDSYLLCHKKIIFSKMIRRKFGSQRSESFQLQRTKTPPFPTWWCLQMAKAETNSCFTPKLLLFCL